MILVTTGMDNTGKTTLTDSLEKALPSVLHKPGITRVRSLGPATQEEQSRFMLDRIAQGNEEGLILCERFPALDEEVYGPILRTGSNFPMEETSMVWEVLKQELIIVYTRTDSKTIFDFGLREQYPGVIEKRQQLLTAWDNLYFKLFSLGFKIVPYDFKVNNLGYILELAMKSQKKGE